MKKYHFMWDGHFGKIFFSKHRIILSPTEAAPIQADSYKAGPRQQNLQKKEVDQMIKARVAKPLTAE